MREGVDFLFSGSEPDDKEEPSGEVFEITLTVPPLNFSSLRRLGKQKADDAAAVDEQAITAIQYALQRNYAGVPRWLIEQTFDAANMNDFKRALMDEGGVYRKEIEAAKKALAPSTGMASTPT